MKIRIRRPDDMHLHLRDGDILARVAGQSAAHFGRALIMPNLSPPVTTAEMASGYRGRILAARPDGSDFTPLMTIYLTDRSDPADILDAFERKIIAAVKLYPEGATTNSEHGVTSIDRISGVLEMLAEHGIPLCVHGEVAEFDVDVFDREMVFIDRVLDRIMTRQPRLRVILEHVTTTEGLDYTREHQSRMAATITVHHMAINRTHMFRGGLRPHYYCLPVAKREHHRQAILAAATGGESCFFLGTDSAPHLVGQKECASGCAGIYTAPVALPCLAQIFEEAGALDRLEPFASLNGARFYGFEPNPGYVEIIRSADPIALPEFAEAGGERIVIFDPEFDIHWQVATTGEQQDD